MASKGAHKDPAFLKAFAAFQKKWPDVRLCARDRKAWNAAMLETNRRYRERKRKKDVAT